MKDMEDDDKSLEQIGMEALIHAKKAFEDYIFNTYDIDSAYYDIRFIAWINDCNFQQRLARLEIESELKGE